jgi:hypothetical protein
MVGEAERGEKVGVPNTETVTAYNPDARLLEQSTNGCTYTGASDHSGAQAP